MTFLWSVRSNNFSIHKLYRWHTAEVWEWMSNFTPHFTGHFNLSMMGLQLTFCGLVTPYGDIALGQHWLRIWLVAWRHQAITRTNIDLSSTDFCGMHLRAISQEVLRSLICNTNLNSTLKKLYPNLPGFSELNMVRGSHVGHIYVSKSYMIWRSCFIWIYLILKFILHPGSTAAEHLDLDRFFGRIANEYYGNHYRWCIPYYCKIWHFVLIETYSTTDDLLSRCHRWGWQLFCNRHCNLPRRNDAFILIHSMTFGLILWN